MKFDTKTFATIAAFAAILLVATPEQSHAFTADFWDFLNKITTSDLGSGR